MVMVVVALGCGGGGELTVVGRFIAVLVTIGVGCVLRLVLLGYLYYLNMLNTKIKDEM